MKIQHGLGDKRNNVKNTIFFSSNESIQCRNNKIFYKHDVTVECVSRMCSAHQANLIFMLIFLTIVFGYKMKIRHLISVDELSRFCYQRQRTLPPIITLCSVSWFEHGYYVITALNIITLLCKCPPPINTSFCRLSLTLRIAEGKVFFFSWPRI